MKYFNENKQVIKAQSGTIVRNLRPITVNSSQPYRTPEQESLVTAERNMYYDALRHFQLGDWDAQGLAETYNKYPKLRSYLKRIGMSENDFMSLATGRAFENDSYERNRTKQFNRDIQKDQSDKANKLMQSVSHQNPNDKKLANIMTGILTFPFASELVASPIASAISNPIRTGVTFAGGAIGGKGVDNSIQKITGDNSFGEMMGRVTNTPELSGLYEFANPGYALGGWAANGLYGGLRSGATRFISKVMLPEMLAVAVTPTGQRVPVRINNSTMNITNGKLSLRERLTGKVKSESTTSQPSSTSTTETPNQPSTQSVQNPPKGIQVVDRKGNKRPLYKQGIGEDILLVGNDEVLSPNTIYYKKPNLYSKPLKKVHTNTGYGDFNLTTATYLTPTLHFKFIRNHPWITATAATGIGGAILIYGFNRGLKNAPSDAGKVVKRVYNGPNNTNDSIPVEKTENNTPINTPQTPDTTGRAERMAQRRRELGITE